MLEREQREKEKRGGRRNEHIGQLSYQKRASADKRKAEGKCRYSN